MKNKLFIMLLACLFIIPFNNVKADVIEKPEYNIEIKEIDSNKIQMDFCVDNFEEVYAADINLDFTEDFINALEILDGDVIANDENSKVIIENINNENGQIHYCITKVGDVENVKDSGILFSVIFDVTNKTGLEITLNEKSILSDNDGNRLQINKHQFGDMVIEQINNIHEFNLGQDAVLDIKVTNGLENSQEVTLLVALFNADNNQFLSYAAVNRTVESGEEIELSGMLSIPEQGNYVVKGFVIDNIMHGKPLSDVIVIPVK